MGDIVNKKNESKTNGRLFTRKQLDDEFGIRQQYEWTTMDSFGRKHIRASYYVEVNPITKEEFINLYDVEIESWYE